MLFNAQFGEVNYNGADDWGTRLTEQTDNVE